ncbi:MAG: hypothetical protein ACREOF_05730 [Gemmatimonadales bacterium]
MPYIGCAAPRRSTFVDCRRACDAGPDSAGQFIADWITQGIAQREVAPVVDIRSPLTSERNAAADSSKRGTSRRGRCPASLTLGGDDGLETPVARRKTGPIAKLTDVNRDGFVDLVADFDERAMMNNGELAAGISPLVLLGRLKEGKHIRGTDVIQATQ